MFTSKPISKANKSWWVVGIFSLSILQAIGLSIISQRIHLWHCRKKRSNKIRDIVTMCAIIAIWMLHTKYESITLIMMRFNDSPHWLHPLSPIWHIQVNKHLTKISHKLLHKHIHLEFLLHYWRWEYFIMMLVSTHKPKIIENVKRVFMQVATSLQNLFGSKQSV